MVYSIKVTLPESKVFYRVYAVKGEMTLYALHTFICENLNFDTNQMVFFNGYDESGARKGSYGLFDMGGGSMDQVTLTQLIAKGETNIRYFFDMRRKRYFIITVEGVLSDTRLTVPVLLEGKGDDPEQFAEKYVDPDVVAPRTPVTGDFDDDDDEDDDEDDDLDDEDDEEDEDDDEDGKELIDEEETKNL